MKLDKIAKKSIAIFSVLLLILSLNISTNVSAALVKDDDYGVAYDEFEDDTSFTLENCTYDDLNNSIILERKPLQIIYDHKRTPDNIKAWENDNPFLVPGGDLFTVLSSLTNPNMLKKYEFEDLSTIDFKDGEYYETISEASRPSNYVYWPLHLFEIQVDEDVNRLDDFMVDWYSGPYDENAYVEEISMYMWSYGQVIPRWNFIQTLEYTENNIGKIPISSEKNAKTFMSEDGILHILIIAKPIPDIYPVKPAILSTDYIKMELSTKIGYSPTGYVTSQTISPTKFKGWETLIWDSSKPTEDSRVKLQVLDNKGDVITTLDGNSDGFLTSPVSLSSLGSSPSEIKLQAILISEKYGMTPHLFSWAVLWQTTDGFYDSFSYDYRIGESNGVKIESGNIEISEFYSEWPIFGKNPANTRSYVGQDIKYEGNKTYWRTYIDKDIAGWFRSPVMSEGRVYIGANDKKIYAFDLSLDSGDDENAYDPIDESTPDYEVESGVAIGNGYVVFGTSKLDSKNNIYGLNSTDLSIKKWNYSISNDKTICFSAAPTISDGNVYITSWSGKFANSPIISYIYSKINALLDYALSNNKLIALDITTGDEIWKPIDLPAASLSTPAVNDGLIFVGCDNIDGSSVFAFDEDTGEEVWNASIGAVGRASPVVAEGEDGKIVVVSVREQESLFSFSGTDKVVALDANDGSMLWNLTIGNQSTFFRSVDLRSKNFTNLKATSLPAATPAVFEDTVYVMAPNGKLYALDINTGEEKWSFEDSVSTAYHAASPVVVDDTVYITSQNSYLYSINSNNGELIFDFPVEYENIGMSLYIYASPIVTDGLVVVSTLESLGFIHKDYYGHLLCLGEYKRNSIGNIYSTPIHVQKGKWWNKFNATCDNTGENNTITFSILDENSNPISGYENLDGDDNNISGVGENVIQLFAEFEIGNFNESLPVLRNWRISWNIENKAPVFDGSSFRAGQGQEGWINIEDLPECSIDVKDYGTDSIVSGLDVDSAKFDLGYVTTSDKAVTETFNAVCDGESGDEQVKVIAKLSELDIEIKELKNITFNIKDLAGNSADPYNETFKTDTVKPTSEIKDKESFEDKYNSEVLISAEGNDAKSGLANIALYYRIEGTTTWTKYGSDASPYDWLFKNDTSDYYELCTIATDKAGNSEDFPDDGDISFLFDMNKPSKPDFDEKYSFDALPEFSITFKDDYQLESVDYRLNIHGTDEWTPIGSNLDDKSYTGEWSLSQDDWDTMLEDVAYDMYFRITDFCGNQYITSGDEALNLTKDVSPPIVVDITLDLSSFEEGGWDDEFTITADVPDDVEVQYISLRYSYSSDNSKWSEWKDYGDDLTDEPFEWDFKAEEGSGYYKFKTIITDSEGQLVESPVKTVEVTLFPTTLVLLLIILIIILFGLSVFVIRKMKKK